MLSLLMVIIGFFKVSRNDLDDFRVGLIVLFTGEFIGFIWGSFLVYYLLIQ